MIDQQITASQLLRRIREPDAGVREAMRRTYGTDSGLIGARARLIGAVLNTFLARFGDRPVRVFRSPGRINLRGMHVDTHGGYLNLMTHQREVVVALAHGDQGVATFANIEPGFEDIRFAYAEEVERARQAASWARFIEDPWTQRKTQAFRGHWGQYVKGSLLAALRREHENMLSKGVCGVVGSDIPRGAALSSSAALCVALVSGFAKMMETELTPEEVILAARDAEWFTGSRCGISDQAAVVLGEFDEIVNVALLAEALDVSDARRLRLPDALRVLVVDSFTERSLSGTELVEYTRNRFAYSLAMAILQQEMRAEGLPDEAVSCAERLAYLVPERLAPWGGESLLYRMLQRIPERIGIEEVRRRYALPHFDEVHRRYFGGVPEGLRPTEIGLRGPLLFGIAESERARVFPEILEKGNYTNAGRLMSLGHDGDRRVSQDGTPFSLDISDAALARLAASRKPISECPGIYGASSPVLDLLADTAMASGALGACLTGAGIAGTVLALCLRKDTDRVTGSLVEMLVSREYMRRAGRTQPLDREQLARAVVTNQAPAAAGELRV